MDEKKSAARFDDAAGNLGKISGCLSALPMDIKSQAHEIRLRSGRPVMISLAGKGPDGREGSDGRSLPDALQLLGT